MNSKMLTWRRCSQLYFLLLMITAGYFLSKALILLPTLGIAAVQYRFPVLEGFLPISATVGLKHWLMNGEFDPIHPAGLTILLLTILSALLLKRGFCSHICPIGTLSEYLFKARAYFYSRKLRVPAILHYPLMTPKYLLLLFLLIVVLIGMQPDEIAFFIRSPYNTIAEVKMLYFFSSPSLLTLKVLTVLILFSLLIQNFWCRYLCPYGALLSFCSLFSPVAITRNSKQCISCQTCDKLCPSQLTISSATNISSPECTICQNCINNCPRGVLKIHSSFATRPLSTGQYSCFLVGLFLLGILIATISGHWRSVELPVYWIKYAPLANMIFH